MMQSSGAPVTETSMVYCPAVLTHSAAAAGGTKPLAETSSQQHHQLNPRSHLVTNRAYTASKLTSDYVLETSVDGRPLQVVTGKLSDVKSEVERHARNAVAHNVTHQKKESANIENNETSVHIQSSSDDRNPSTRILKIEKSKTETESIGFSRNEPCSQNMPHAKNNLDGMYCEFENGDNAEHCNDIVLPSKRPAEAAPVGDVTVERNKLLQHVSQLIVEKQEVVYRLRDFVETNAQLHAELERSRIVIADLQSKLHEVESMLKHEQHEKAVLNRRLAEQTGLQPSASIREPCPNNALHQKSEDAVLNTGEVDSLGSSSSSDVQTELQRAVQLAIDQQKQLEDLRNIVEQQNKHISRLYRRDVNLGLELRPSSIQQKNSPCDVSTQAATTEMTPAAATAAAEPVKPEAQVFASRRDFSDVPATAVHVHRPPPPPSSSSPRRAAVDAATSHAARERRTIRGSPPPATRPTSHTAPARPLPRPEPELAAAAAARHTDLESLPAGFEMTTACPICQTPIPFNAASSEDFSRHVDECISRVTREGPSGSLRDPASANRTCPVCDIAYPADTFSQSDFERHVNNHFDDAVTS